MVHINYRPILSSKRVPHIKKSAIIRQKTKNLVVSFRWEPGTKTDRPTVGLKLTSTSTAGSKSEAVNVLTPHSLLRPGTGKSYRHQRFGWASCTYHSTTRRHIRQGWLRRQRWYVPAVWDGTVGTLSTRTGELVGTRTSLPGIWLMSIAVSIIPSVKRWWRLSNRSCLKFSYTPWQADEFWTLLACRPMKNLLTRWETVSLSNSSCLKFSWRVLNRAGLQANEELVDQVRNC
jgi:hypothetical protein